MRNELQAILEEPSPSIEGTSARVSARSGALQFWLAGAGIVAVLACILLWVRGGDPVPGGDVGGYIHMLRHFLATGRVDYMKWCQPTFIGLLPIAAPWGLAFGTGIGSLSLMGIGYAIVFITGSYLLVSRYTTWFMAALVCLSLLCFADFLPCASSFMTDIPYVAYFVWFLLAHHLLMDVAATASKGRVLIWGGWCVSFMLAALTRPFIFIVIPVFFLQWMFAVDGKRRFYRNCTVTSTALAMLSFAVIAALGENRFTPIEQTSLREVFVFHDYGRFNIQAMLLALLNTGLLALPALLLSAQARKARLSLGDIGAVALGLIVGFYYWRRGMFSCALPIANPNVIKWVTLAQVMGAAIGWGVIGRLLISAIRGFRSGMAPVLAVVIVAQFAVMPIMQHPLMRHVLPAFIALTILIVVTGIRSPRSVLVFSVCLILVLASSNAVNARDAAKVEETVWRVNRELVDSGVKLDQIDGGWGWFCYFHLRPGETDVRGYRARYYELRDHARFSVGTERPLSGQGTVRELDCQTVFGKTVKIFAVDRQSAATQPAAGGTAHER